ncbi:GAF domain-containing protein, partial [Candidatus Poribacteria bacterium]
MGERSELERRLKELSLLYEISSLLTSAVDVDELLNLIARIVVEKLGVKACSVRLLDEETGEMVLKAVYGLSREYIDKGPVVVWKSPLKDVIMKGETVYIEDASTDPRVQYPEEARKEGIKSMLCLALMINGKPIGALSVYTDRPRRFTIDEIWLLQSIAN